MAGGHRSVSATLADPGHDGYALVWDGSYFMMNSDIDSSLLTGHKLIVMVCDNGGFAVRVCSSAETTFVSSRSHLGVCAAGIAGWEDFISNLSIV